MATDDHNAVLKAAAHAALDPLGLTQIGRSRTWIEDRGWHLIVVEFQPSGWSKGSYLNVVAMWLWHGDDHLAFDYTGQPRVQPWIQVDEGWATSVKTLSDLAASRVVDLRRDLRDVRTVAKLLGRRRFGPEIPPGWPTFHAAIAAGLANDTRAARPLMARLIDMRVDFEWQQKMVDEMVAYADLLGDRALLRRRVAERVVATRALLKLPELGVDDILILLDH